MSAVTSFFEVGNGIFRLGEQTIIVARPVIAFVALNLAIGIVDQIAQISLVRCGARAEPAREVVARLTRILVASGFGLRGCGWWCVRPLARRRACGSTDDGRQLDAKRSAALLRRRR